MMTLTFNHEAEAIAIMHHITQFAQENNNIVQAEEDSFSLEYFVSTDSICVFAMNGEFLSIVMSVVRTGTTIHFETDIEDNIAGGGYPQPLVYQMMMNLMSEILDDFNQKEYMNSVSEV